MKRLQLIAETLVGAVLLVALVILAIWVLRFVSHACQHGCLLGAL